MPVMEWDDSLVLDRGVMDDTHREFIGLLNRLADAPDAAADLFERGGEGGHAGLQRVGGQHPPPHSARGTRGRCDF